MSLKDVLPCKYCRQNLPKNMAAVEKSKNLSLKKALKSRAKLSRWVYYLPIKLIVCWVKQIN